MMGVRGDPTHRDAAVEHDRRDPLASFPSQFYVADPDACYLDGNSLGRVPLATMHRMTAFLADEWGAELVDGWSHWIDEAERAGDQLARAALGAGPGQTLVADTTSVNLYQLLDAVVASRPGKSTILVDSANFPTDRYVVHGIANNRGLEVVTLDVDGSGGPGAVAVTSENDRLTPELLESFLTDDVAVITLQW
jgi:Kynureninase